MVVGYALGNKDVESDIQVLGENDPDVITYSRSHPISLTRRCRNNCPYCGYNRHDSISVPYSTIQRAKDARQTGVREGLYVAGERPDKFPEIRSILDLWGFSSYHDYIYTVCELGFLEGLIPVIEVGFLSPIEMKKIAEICALAKIMLDSVPTDKFDSIYPDSPGKSLDLRLKGILWAGKQNFPVASGLMVGIGETKAHRKEVLSILAQVHKKYGHIHEVLIQDFVPAPGTKMAKANPPSHKDMVATVEMAREILPEDVSVIVPVTASTQIEDFVKAGVRDLGRIMDRPDILIPGQAPVDFDALSDTVSKLGFRLQQRFPLRFDYIKEGRYSKKLGQVFDAYRYKIKKDEQEKAKEAKVAASE